MTTQAKRTVLYALDSSNLTPLNQAVTAGNITHILISLFHLGYDDEKHKTGPYIHLNNHTPDNFPALWKQVPVWQQAGVKVMGSMGGGGVGDFNNLFSAYSVFYPILKKTLKTYDLDGLDLDIEESNTNVNDSHVKKLVNDLRQDFKHRSQGFLLSSAPVASALTGGGSVSMNVDYNSLLSLFDFYNLQFYGWGDLNGNGSANNPNYTTVVNAVGAANTSKMVAGTLTNPSNGNGFLATSTVVSIVSNLVNTYPNFGGVMGWHYDNALNSSAQVDPAGWCADITGAQT